ncbi:MAG TPA: SDR family NAD(P)-dependent oxidoreductase [Candidatus Limnocylindrales bacterium]
MSQVVAITAPASGIGRAQARAYAAAGWDVALIGRGWAGLEAAAADVRAEGREALVVPIDLADPAARALALDRISRELGPIDAWVADGALPRHGPTIRTTAPRSRRRAVARAISNGWARARSTGLARLGAASLGITGAGVLAALAVGRLARRP